MRISDWGSDGCSSDLLFAVSVLRKIAEVHREARGDSAAAADAEALAAEVEAALKRHALIPDGKGGQVWAYEIDGFGNWIFMDDANVPSLSGLALIDVVSRDDPLFRRTADLAWSDRNPYFFKRSEEHTSELQSLMRISYAVFCLKKKK